MNFRCSLCERHINQDKTGEPYLKFHKPICFQCYVDLIDAIYSMAGYGDGGLIHIAFKMCLSSAHNKKKRSPIRQYRKVFKQLMAKYKYQCVHCKESDSQLLTIDHIKPVSKGGSDAMSNLQILCRSCNSSKGNR